MTTDKTIEEVIESAMAEVAGLPAKEHKNVIGDKWKFIKAIVQKLLDDGYCKLHPDQSLPDNLAWHKVEREFEAYCAGRNDILSQSWKRVIEK